MYYDYPLPPQNCNPRTFTLAALAWGTTKSSKRSKIDYGGRFGLNSGQFHLPTTRESTPTVTTRQPGRVSAGQECYQGQGGPVCDAQTAEASSCCHMLTCTAHRAQRTCSSPSHIQSVFRLGPAKHTTDQCVTNSVVSTYLLAAIGLLSGLLSPNLVHWRELLWVLSMSPKQQVSPMHRKPRSYPQL